MVSELYLNKANITKEKVCIIFLSFFFLSPRFVRTPMCLECGFLRLGPLLSVGQA